MTTRVQVSRHREGKFVAKCGDVEADADTEARAVEAVLRKIREARPAQAAAADERAVVQGSTMGEGPSAPLGAKVGD